MKNETDKVKSKKSKKENKEKDTIKASDELRYSLMFERRYKRYGRG